MKKLYLTLIRASVLAAFVALSAVPASADTFTYFSGLHDGFNRPNAGAPPTTLSGLTVPFNAQGFMVSIDGPYSFTLTADLNDFVPFLVLYQNSFDASTPLSNALIADGAFAFNLSSGTTYMIVPTRLSPSLDGTFHGTITGPGEITPVGGVIIPEPTTMVLLSTGLLGIAAKVKRRKKQSSI